MKNLRMETEDNLAEHLARRHRERIIALAARLWRTGELEELVDLSAPAAPVEQAAVMPAQIVFGAASVELAIEPDNVQANQPGDVPLALSGMGAGVPPPSGSLERGTGRRS